MKECRFCGNTVDIIKVAGRRQCAYCGGPTNGELFYEVDGKKEKIVPDVKKKVRSEPSIPARQVDQWEDKPKKKKFTYSPPVKRKEYRGSRGYCRRRVNSGPQTMMMMVLMIMGTFIFLPGLLDTDWPIPPAFDDPFPDPTIPIPIENPGYAVMTMNINYWDGVLYNGFVSVTTEADVPYRWEGYVAGGYLEPAISWPLDSNIDIVIVLRSNITGVPTDELYSLSLRFVGQAIDITIPEILGIIRPLEILM